MDIKTDIKSFFKGDVTTAPADLDKFSRDASLFSLKPSLVAAPQGVEDLKGLVRYVTGKKSEHPELSLTARSAGTDMTGGPLTESIVVNFLPHFNKVKEVGSDSAIVEPGTYYRDFEKATMEQGLLMPAYPASRELCTVGGMVANNCGGEKSLTYGKVERYVRKLKVILADGEEYTIEPMNLAAAREKAKQKTFSGAACRQILEIVENNYDLLQKAKPEVSKNSAGFALWDVLDKTTGVFDLTRLFVGSQGTLGLITEITFKLVKPKQHSGMLLIFLDDLAPLPEIINHVLRFKPDSFESYDDHTFTLALRMFPQIAHRLKGHLFRLFLEYLPEFKLALTHKIPKLVMLVEFSGDSKEEVSEKLAQTQASLQEFKVRTRITKTAFEAQRYWTIRRESFSLLRKPKSRLRTAPFIDDIAVRPDKLPEFLPKLNALLEGHDMVYTVAGHIGEGNFHIIPLIDMHKPTSKIMIQELTKKVYDLVFSYNGSMTGEHNDGLIRTPFLPQMYGVEVYHLFEQTKKAFDPQNIFNPGKKVGDTLEYAFSHLDES